MLSHLLYYLLSLHLSLCHLKLGGKHYAQLFIFPKNNDIFLCYHSTIIKLRKLNTIIISILILPSVPIMFFNSLSLRKGFTMMHRFGFELIILLASTSWEAGITGMFHCAWLMLFISHCFPSSRFTLQLQIALNCPVSSLLKSGTAP